MSPSQSLPVQPDWVNLDQFEMSIVDSMTQNASGQWNCKHCDAQFNNIMRLVTHLLISSNHHVTTSISTFSNLSAIKICMLLDESNSTQMFECYLRVAREDHDLELMEEDEDEDSSAAGDKTRSSKTTSQMFPANPPQSLSADEGLEWIFKRTRKC